MTAMCKHCGEEIGEPGGFHTRTKLYSCDTEVSGLKYGYSAEAVGEPCTRPCVGVNDGG